MPLAEGGGAGANEAELKPDLRPPMAVVCGRGLENRGGEEAVDRLGQGREDPEDTHRNCLGTAAASQ